MLLQDLVEDYCSVERSGQPARLLSLYPPKYRRLFARPGDSSRPGRGRHGPPHPELPALGAAALSADGKDGYDGVYFPVSIPRRQASLREQHDVGDDARTIFFCDFAQDLSQQVTRRPGAGGAATSPWIDCQRRRDFGPVPPPASRRCSRSFSSRTHAPET